MCKRCDLYAPWPDVKGTGSDAFDMEGIGLLRVVNDLVVPTAGDEIFPCCSSRTGLESDPSLLEMGAVGFWA